MGVANLLIVLCVDQLPSDLVRLGLGVLLLLLLILVLLGRGTMNVNCPVSGVFLLLFLPALGVEGGHEAVCTYDDRLAELVNDPALIVLADPLVSVHERVLSQLPRPLSALVATGANIV